MDNYKLECSKNNFDIITNQNIGIGNSERGQPLGGRAILIIEDNDMKCKHENLKLIGHEPPGGLTIGGMWLSDLGLVCQDCGTHLVTMPDSVNHIKNIPHPSKEECEHPNNTKLHPLNVIGGWTCLQCGASGIASPTCKLEVISAEEAKRRTESETKIAIGPIQNWTGLYIAGKRVWQFTCPCGITDEFKINELPEVDTLQSCGNPNHYFIQYGLIL